MFLAELRRKVPVNDDDLIPANLPRQALRNEFFALLAVGRQPGSGPETGFWEVRQIGTDKSATVELSKFLDSVGVLRPGVPQMSGCVLLNLKSERVAAELIRTLDVVEKMVDERGFEPPASPLRTGNH